MKFHQQCIQQAAIVIDSRFCPMNNEQNPAKLPAENIPTGALMFRKVHVPESQVRQQKNRRVTNFVKPITSTKPQPLVFCNLKHAKAHEDVSFAGIADTEITIDGDHWRYSGSNRSVIVRGAGTRSIINSGDEACYEGEWLYWSLPSKDPSYMAQAPNEPIHRAVVRPITEANFARDPTCIHRTIGKCLSFGEAGQQIDISISSAVAPIPPKYAMMVARELLRQIQALEANAGNNAAVATSFAPSAPDLQGTAGRGDGRTHLGRRPPPREERKFDEKHDDDADEPSTTRRRANTGMPLVSASRAPMRTERSQGAENEEDDDDDESMSEASEATATTSSSTATQ